MDYLLTFLEGFASFISPCVLPMIPLYLSYFAGENTDERFAQPSGEEESLEQQEDKKIGNSTNSEQSPEETPKSDDKKKYRILWRALFFVMGFTLMFVIFGGLVGLVSGYIVKYKKIINIVAGIVVIIFGLSYMGLFRLPFFKG